ncbi:MAG: phosphoribosylaminoimidazolesuccinocarboxamide synthase [Halioglobus sp.]
MHQADSVLAVNDDFPIRTDVPVHSGKVRSVYWLTAEDSARLIAQRNYDVAPDAPLAIMIISDRLSAFDCIWHAQGGLNGVPGKGAALNTISNHWFSLFKANGLAQSHILEVPHPLVWIVQKAKPVMIEAIARQYITGSMWRAYEAGERTFCGIDLTDGLEKDQKLPELLITPSTKGILTGIPNVPAVDDVNITQADIAANYADFNFRVEKDVLVYERLLREGFALISERLAALGQVFVDTKFEFGYVTDRAGNTQLIYMDEVGTPDSSRIWDAEALQDGQVVENSKEGFRQALLAHVPDPDVLLNKNRMEERAALACDTALPEAFLLAVSRTYVGMAEKITGKPVAVSPNPRAEIIDVLRRDFALVD